VTLRVQSRAWAAWGSRGADLPLSREIDCTLIKFFSVFAAPRTTVHHKLRLGYVRLVDTSFVFLSANKRKVVAG
jgi:hypothetical protein